MGKPDEETELFTATDIQDAMAWLKSRNAPAATPPAATTPIAPPAPAHAAPSVAPAAHVATHTTDSVRKWTEEQVLDHLAKNGGDASNPMAWTNRRASIELAQRLANEMARIRIVGRKG